MRIKLMYRGEVIFSSIFILYIFLLTSCSYLVGYRKIYDINKDKIDSVCKKYNSEECIILDTGYLVRLRNTLTDSIEIKNMYQPLQVHYFIDGRLKSSLINCYAPGVFKLDWNTENRLDTFPPKSHVRFKVEMTLLDFNKLMGIENINLEKNIVYVVWTNSFINNSENLIELVKGNIEKYCPSCHLKLINIDVVFIEIE